MRRHHQAMFAEQQTALMANLSSWVLVFYSMGGLKGQLLQQFNVQVFDNASDQHVHAN